MTRVERQVIKKSYPLWGVIDDMCFKAKNLYNYANYILRQEFIQNNNYISYRQMNKELKTHEEYKECMSQPANCILRLLDKNWKSYFQAIKQYSKYPNKFLGKPNIPNYKKKNGRCNWIIPNNSCYYDNGELKFRIRKLQSIKWKCGCKGRWLIATAPFFIRGDIVKLKDRISKLIDVKSLISLLFAVCLSIAFLKGNVNVKDYLTVCTMAFTFFFSYQTNKSNNEKGE